MKFDAFERKFYFYNYELWTYLVYNWSFFIIYINCNIIKKKISIVIRIDKSHNIFL